MESKYKVFYIRDKKRFPVACVVSQKKGIWVEYAISTYNPADEFAKYLGRQIAQKRLEAGRITDTVKAEVPMIKRSIMQSICQGDNKIGQRAKDAALWWLKKH